MNYFNIQGYVSNSDLGALDKALKLRKDMEGLQKIYDFGNLVDAMSTESHKVDYETNTWVDDDRAVTFSKEDFERADLMRKALEADPFLEIAFKNMKFQHVILRRALQIEYEGNVFTLPVKCKMDGYKKGFMTLDIKTTACTTYAQFVAAFFHFDYDRQAAWYMDLARVDRMIYVGVSKKPNKRTGKHDVFKFVVERGDSTYLSGYSKYSRLAFKYFHYIHNLNFSLFNYAI